MVLRLLNFCNHIFISFGLLMAFSAPIDAELLSSTSLRCNQLFTKSQDDFSLARTDSEILTALTSKEIKLLQDSYYLGRYYDANNNYINQEAMELADKLIFLNEAERAKWILKLKGSGRFKKYSSLYGDYFLLYLYDESTWLEFMDRLIMEEHFNGRIWYYKGELINNMDEHLFSKIISYLENKITEAPFFQVKKEASRILYFFKYFFEKPELELLRSFQNHGALSPALQKYFNWAHRLSSPYTHEHRFSEKNLGQLAFLLKSFFQQEALSSKYKVIYWFGSIPNGRGWLDSDMDLAFDGKFSEAEAKQLFSFLSSSFAGFLKNHEQAFDVKTPQYVAKNLMHLSPISVAIIDGKLHLVVCTFTKPKETFKVLSSGLKVLSDVPVTLWHFPVDVDAEGNWSYTEDAVPWKLEY